MLFVRIVEGKNTINGIKMRKVYIYEPLSWKNGQYDYASEEIYRKFNYGRYYKDKHFLSLSLYKNQILEQLEKVFGKDNFVYIFE